MRLGLRNRADGATCVRPGGALVLCTLVWAFCAATVLQAFWLLGADGWSFAVLPAAASVVVWAVLWAPRVIVHEDRIEVRNVFVTHLLPMGAISDVRLGAMLRFDLEAGSRMGSPAVITAWNAPGVGRDRPRERLSRRDRRASRDVPLERGSWVQRLRRDQLASPSHVAVQAWERWTDRHDEAAETAAERPTAERRVNGSVFGALALSLLAMIVRGLL